MKYNITGDNLQIVTCELAPNERVYAEAGAMVYMSGNMTFEARAKGGVMKGLKRKLAGESFFLTEFTPAQSPGYVGFGGRAPGTIKCIELVPGREFMVQKDAFLCAENSVALDMAWQKKLGASLFGGEGFILQKLSGQGKAFIHAAGDFVEMNLAPGQVIKVDTGSVVGWDASVTFDIQRSGGLKTMMFSGEGIFLTTLTGPGKILLQSMNLPELAATLSRYMPQQSSGSSSLFG
ncbi:MAG: TIGR00266 family protein [Thermoplasmata archaeon]